MARKKIAQPDPDATPVVAIRDEKCTVCGEPVAPNSAEHLCWVCRRLKISAWRDSDLQASLTE